MNFFSESNNKKVTICCLIAALVCLYFINDDSLFNSSAANSSNIIGGFDRTKKDVRRKSSFNYFWDEITNSDSLKEGDSIYTGPDSGVTVKLLNGQKIMIQPNSLIKFSMRNKKMYLDIPYGSLKLDAVSKDVIITDCGAELDFGPDSSAVDFNKSDKCGDIKIKTQSAKIKRALDKKLIQSNVENLFDELELASALKEIIPNESTVASNLSEQQITSMPSVATPEVQIEPTLLNKASEDPVLLNKLANTEDKFRLKAPRFKTKVFEIESGSSEPVSLVWNKVKGANLYQVEISESPRFETFKSFQTSETTYTVLNAKDDLYFRLKAIPDKKINNQIQNSKFSSIAKLSTRVPAIQLVEKQIIKNYNAKSSADQGNATDFNVKWSGVPKTKEYQLDLINPETSQTIQQFKTRMPSGVVSGVAPGKYKYQVHALDKNGRKVSSSEVGDILYNRLFSLIAPKIKIQFQNMFFFFQKEAAKYIWFGWDGQSDEFQFKIELSKNEDFSSIVKSAVTNKNKYLLTSQLDPGDYFWRVRAQNKQQYSDWSETQIFKVQIQAK